MSKQKQKTTVAKNRFVISKSMVGKNLIITFVNKKKVQWTYDHDEVYNTFKDKFDNMPCFEKYGNYTNTNAVPKFARELESVWSEANTAE